MPWGAALATRTVGPVALAYVAAPDGEPDRGVAKAMHDAVLHLATAATVMPLRLGPPAPLQVLLDALAPRADLAVRALRHLHERVELDTRWPVRLTSSVLPQPVPASAPGAAFLASRRQAHAGVLAAELEAERIDALLGDLAGVCAVHAPPSSALDTERAVIQRALLVPGDRAHAVTRRLDSLATQHGLGVRITGPWPAWSFAGWAFDQAKNHSRMSVSPCETTHKTLPDRVNSITHRSEGQSAGSPEVPPR